MTSTARLSDPAIASQAVFRAVMDALAHPGTIRLVTTLVVPPHPLYAATAAIARTLLDYETPVWLDAPLAAADGVATWLRFETGAPVVTDTRQAAFALLADPLAMPPFDAFPLGTHDYPDRATMLVIQVESFEAGETMMLTGPGLAGPRRLRAAPLPADFVERMVANRGLFPLGVDLVLVCDRAVAALPRSVRIERGNA